MAKEKSGKSESAATQFLTTIAQEFNRDKFETLNECISFDDYLNRVIENEGNLFGFSNKKMKIGILPK